jgi:hypothetical protein
MKTKSKCIGCQSIKLVNALGLCKRCNRHAHDFISDAEMVRIKRERELFLSSKSARKAKAAAKAAEAEKEEGTEGDEETAEDTGEADTDAGSKSSSEGGSE